jgi:Protein of unknown function (DUF3800)
MAGGGPRAETRPVEIACDESGYEGEKLIGTSTDVFAHASVGMDLASAADCMRELRDRIRSPAQEYKANHILREKHRRVLDWFLGPSGPVLGHTHVYLIDKEFFVLTRVVEVLGADPALALDLYRQRPDRAFLEAANNLLRGKEREDVVADFFRALPTDSGLAPARPLAEAFRAALDPAALSAVDPLIPAILAAVTHWGRDGSPITIVHDRQTTLPVERVTRLRRRCPRLAGLTFVDSRLDPRVQVADVLAGAVRKIASDELNGRADERLTALLPPYVDPSSVWGDDPSWSRPRPPGHGRV